jgi:membrane protein
MKSPLHWQFWIAVLARYNRRGGRDAVSILAYTSLISLVPVLIVTVALFSLSPYLAQFQHLVMAFMIQHALPSNYPVIATSLIAFSEKAHQMTWPGLAMMLITTLMLLWQVDERINQLLDAQARLHWRKRIFKYLGVSLLGPILFGLSLALSSYLLTIDLWTGFAPVKNQALDFLPLLIALLGFSLMFKWIPHTSVPWKAAFFGGTLAALGIELLKHGLTLYLTWFPSYNFIYGAFAALPLFLLWLYLFWSVILLSASSVAQFTLYQTHQKQKTSA